MGLGHIAQSLRYNGIHDLPYRIKQSDRSVGPQDGVVVLALLSQHHCRQFSEVLRTVAELKALVEDHH